LISSSNKDLKKSNTSVIEEELHAEVLGEIKGDFNNLFKDITRPSANREISLRNLNKNHKIFFLMFAQERKLFM